MCEGLPVIDSILDMSSTVFPILSPRMITVGCEDPLVLTGDNTITCIGDTEYIYRTRPACVDKGEFKLSIIRLN